MLFLPSPGGGGQPETGQRPGSPVTPRARLMTPGALAPASPSACCHPFCSADGSEKAGTNLTITRLLLFWSGWPCCVLKLHLQNSLEPDSPCTWDEMWELKWDLGLWEFAPLPGQAQTPHLHDVAPVLSGHLCRDTGHLRSPRGSALPGWPGPTASDCGLARRDVLIAVWRQLPSSDCLRAEPSFWARGPKYQQP